MGQMIAKTKLIEKVKMRAAQESKDVYAKVWTGDGIFGKVLTLDEDYLGLQTPDGEEVCVASEEVEYFILAEKGASVQPVAEME